MVARIRGGTLLLKSREEYERLLERYPQKASLHRVFADFLVRQGDRPSAVRAYDKASQIYLDTGRSLQAIVATILAWSLVKPTHDQGRIFHAAVQAAIKAETPLQSFFGALTYPELVAVMLRLVRVQHPANYAVKKYGDSADELFFIVAGKLKETTYLSASGGESDHTASVRYLSENDIFGDVYPFAMENASRSDVEALTHVELVKITRKVLQQLCRKHPRVELLLAKLHKDPTETQDGRMWSSVRRTVRHEIPTKVSLVISPTAENAPLIQAAGFTRDISLGGVCVELGEKRLPIPVQNLKGAGVRVLIKLPGIHPSLEIDGTIVWSAKPQSGESEGILVGVQFRTLSDAERNALEAYCSGGDAEQNLLWNLWDDFMKG
jgi:CRP-like cAMP-binding protein